MGYNVRKLNKTADPRPGMLPPFEVIPAAATEEKKCWLAYIRNKKISKVIGMLAAVKYFYWRPICRSIN